MYRANFFEWMHTFVEYLAEHGGCGSAGNERVSNANAWCRRGAASEDSEGFERSEYPSFESVA